MHTEAIQELLFDWDGTIADTEKISAQITDNVLTEAARKVFGRSFSELLKTIDMRGKDFAQIGQEFEDVINTNMPPAGKQSFDLEHLRIHHLRPQAANALLQAPLADNILEAMQAIHDAEQTGISIVTNSPRMRVTPLLTRNNLDKIVSMPRIFSAFEDTEKRLKPLPDIFLLAAKRLNVHPKNAASVEDSVTGVTAAKEAGIGLRIGFVGIHDKHEPQATRGLKNALEKAGAHIVISDMRELPEVISHVRRPMVALGGLG